MGGMCGCRTPKARASMDSGLAGINRFKFAIAVSRLLRQRLRYFWHSSLVPWSLAAKLHSMKTLYRPPFTTIKVASE